MDHLLHHRRATRYIPLHPPPPPAHRHRHRHDLLIPTRVFVDPTAPDFHPSSVLSDNPLLIPHIPLLDLRHHHRPMVSPYPSTANPGHDAWRFRTERFDGGNHHRRVVLAPNLDASLSRDYGTESKLRSQETSRIAASKRRFKNRKAHRVSRDSSFENNGGNRVHESTRTPKKQAKRKSAFLRIQAPKPDNRNSEDEQLNYDDYAVDSNPNSNSSRGKDKHGKKAEEREGSPVELDISFESNSLVAKAIVVPSSSAIVSKTDMTAAVSDTDLPPKRKKRKALVSDSVSSDSQLVKLSTGVVNSNSSPSLVDDTSNSGKDLISQKNVSDSGSQPCSSAIDNPHGKIKAAQSSKGIASDEIANVGSGKTSSRVVKKKKAVKKVVKRVVKPNSTRSSSLLANNPDGTVKADNVIVGSLTASVSDKIKKVSLKDKSAIVEMSIPDCFQSVPGEGNPLLEDQKGDVPFLSSGTHSRCQECNADKDSDIGIERGGDISKPSSCASSKEDKRTDPDCLEANNSSLGVLSMSNTDELTKLLNGSTSQINHSDDDSKQSCQNEESLSSGKDSNVARAQNRYHVGDATNTYLLNTRNSISASGRIAGSSSSDLTGRSEENFIVCDIGNDDIAGKACCEGVGCGKACSENDAPSLSEDVILEENLDIAIPVRGRGMVGFSSSAKNMSQDGPDCLQQASVAKQGSDNESTDLEDSITFPHSDIMNDTGKVSPSNVIVFPENYEFQNSDISIGYGKGDTNKSEERKVSTLFKFSPSKMESMPPDVESPVDLVNVVDTTLNLLKDPSPSEVLDLSVQRLDFGSQSSTDGTTTLNVKRGVSEAELYFGNNGNEDANKVSPLYKRKRTNASHPNFTQCPSELSDATMAATSCAEVPINFSDKQAHKEDVALLSMAILYTSPSAPYTEDVAKLPDDSLGRESFESMDVNRETDSSSSESLELQHSGIAFHSLLEDLATPNVQFLMLEGEQKENATPIVPSSTETGILVIGNVKGEKIDLEDIEENHWMRVFVQRSPSVDMESYDINMKDDLLPLHNCMRFPFDGGEVTTSNFNDALIETVSDALSALPSQGITSEVSDRRVSDCLATNNKNNCEDGENLDSKSMIEQCSDLVAFTSPAQHTGKMVKLNHATGQRNLTMKKMMAQPSQFPSEVATQQSNCSELNGSKKEPHCDAPKTLKGHTFIFSKSKTPASSTHISKSQTWHRTGNNSPRSLSESKPSVTTVPPKMSILEMKGSIQNSFYIRKGNSLVRKATPVSASSQISVANQLPSLGLGKFQKSIRSESRVNVTDQPNLLKTGVKEAPLKGQRILPVPIDTKLEDESSPLTLNLSIGCCENAADPKNVIEANDAPNSSEDVPKYSETFENEIGPSNNGLGQVEVNDWNISSSNAKRIVYIKPKSNQLVATSNSCELSVSTDDKTQTACSNIYYKKSKNQLLRTSFVSHISPTVSIPNSNVNSDGLGACKVICSRRLTKKRSQKVAGSLYKPLKTSLVWTLCGKYSSKHDIASGHSQKFLPQLFPWKRSIRRFIHNPASSSNTTYLSAISKKLLLLRKRDAVYTRSTHGFSLWKPKALGVGGSILKGSKSIDRHSRKVNEEAKLAVAAVERKMREQKDVACNSPLANRERIFCIGSVCYRMDPSRQTLQRISADESLPSASIHLGLANKEVSIPRRLVIGKNVYVRMGNGNQLIRDPKKRTRILANEKVRWSLHTARKRLARKQKYCQFFTRFGKCNKDDGKCPYIHDPSKIAVCSKFLNGLCPNANCKLTHKVIPERMPDCSYFLQGLCTNRSCPYRHVNVNPKASICGEFLKGYCADGNECRKKHSYVCPTFEATGNCEKGTKCKLHHPKKPGEGKKRKRSADHNNSGGRYFGSFPIDISEPGMMVAQKRWQQSNDRERDVADYISFEVDEEVAESVDQSHKQATSCDSDPWDLQLDNLDELIRPVLLMKNNFMAQSSSVK